MKSYLSLVPISARVHRRQNRMTLLCIMISVFLVTSVFSLADLMIQTQTARMLEKHGNWHLKLETIKENDAREIESRPDVTALGSCDVFNYDAARSYYVGDTRAALYGTDEEYIVRIMNGLSEGHFPQNDREVMLDTNTKSFMDIQIGDQITLTTPAGSTAYTVSGFGSDDPAYYRGQTFLSGVYLTASAFDAILDANEIEGSPAYYVQFTNAAKASLAKAELQEQYGLSEAQISENLAVMGLSGRSDSKTMQNWYSLAVVISVFVLLAGIFMISGSMNSNVAQRTQFFGMMRCIGASQQQIIRFVRLEALNWCRTAIPAGVVLGTFVIWGLCAVFKFGIGGEFSDVRLFFLSPAGIISGVVIGIITVLLSAQEPAKRAARVSPITAVSGGAQSTQTIRRAAAGKLGHIDITLGIHHATSARKNWFLMTASFALSIILVFSFSVCLDFAYALVPALRPWQPDLSIGGYANALSLDRELIDEIGRIPGVSHVYGNTYLSDIPASSDQVSIDHVNMVSYDPYMLDCSKKSVVSGDLSDVYGDHGKVATIYNQNNPLNVGDTIEIAGTQVEVACAFSDGLFADDLIVICSEETLDRLMGKQNYGLIQIQLNSDATEETLRSVSAFSTGDQIFSDNREMNQNSTSFYWVTRLTAYSFLVIIGMITICYIINSVSMSVSARVKQYGAMRAVGMDGRQLTRMIAAETFTYALSGFLMGCALGLPLSRFMYGVLITSHFGIAWKVPVSLILIILLFVFAASVAAIYTPAKRIRNMAVADTINEL